MRIQRLTKDAKENLLEDLLKRSPNNYGQYEQGVQEILAHVKEEKDQAVFAYTKKFDHADITADNIKVTEEEIEEAYKEVDPKLVEIIRKALLNIRTYHEKQRRTAGSTANRTEQSWDRRSHHFTELVYMCRAGKRYIHLLY